MENRRDAFALAEHPLSLHRLAVAEAFPGRLMPWSSEAPFELKRAQRDKLGRRIITGMASTDTPDRHGHIMDPDGIVADAYRKNPVFLASHQHHFANGMPGVIGNLTDLRRAKNGIAFTAREAPANPIAPIWFDLYEQGNMRAVSIGWLPLKWEQTERVLHGRPERLTKFTLWELGELSAVAAPATPDALVNSVRRCGMSMEEAIANGLPVPMVNAALAAQRKAPLAASDLADIKRHFAGRFRQCGRLVSRLCFAMDAVDGKLSPEEIERILTEIGLGRDETPDVEDPPADAAELGDYVNANFETLAAMLDACDARIFEMLASANGSKRAAMLARMRQRRGDGNVPPAASADEQRRKRATKAVQSFLDRYRKDWCITPGDAA